MKLIADSAFKWPDLQVGCGITAAAVCEAATNEDHIQKTKYKDMPVFMLDDHTTQGNLDKWLLLKSDNPRRDHFHHT